MWEENKMKKEEAEKLSTDVLILDLLVRMTAIENILIGKNVISEDDYKASVEEIREKIKSKIEESSTKKQSLFLNFDTNPEKLH